MSAWHPDAPHGAELPAWEDGQSALYPAGAGARGIAELGRGFGLALGAIFVLVLLATAWAVWRRRQPTSPDDAPARVDAARETRLHRVIGVFTGLTTVALVVLLFASVITGAHLPGARAPAHGGEAARPLVVKVIGHEWWWEIRYPDADPTRIVSTANELHLPVGLPVTLELSSNDVIHSFWVPRLSGKKDLIPGYQTTTQLVVDAPGVYRGQCAEFCGAQHAHMALLVIAEPLADFDAWRAAQLEPAQVPDEPAARRGQDVFMGAGCPLCHSIRGTLAGGHRAPDLTHLASQRTLAAGTLAQRKGQLAGWILDPQAVKPGALMPPTSLSGPDLQALLAYLESLR
jgi:cytochrome c oxidase subunit 2